jgi:hypothetical protein
LKVTLIVDCAGEGHATLLPRSAVDAAGNTAGYVHGIECEIAADRDTEESHLGSGDIAPDRDAARAALNRDRRGDEQRRKLDG